MWIKTTGNKEETLRGHIPVVQWEKNKPSARMNVNSSKWSEAMRKYKVVTVYKQTSPRGRGKYFVELWENGRATESPRFSTRQKAISFAKKRLGKDKVLVRNYLRRRRS